MRPTVCMRTWGTSDHAPFAGRILKLAAVNLRAACRAGHATRMRRLRRVWPAWRAAGAPCPVRLLFIAARSGYSQWQALTAVNSASGRTFTWPPNAATACRLTACHAAAVAAPLGRLHLRSPPYRRWSRCVRSFNHGSPFSRLLTAVKPMLPAIRSSKCNGAYFPGGPPTCRGQTVTRAHTIRGTFGSRWDLDRGLHTSARQSVIGCNDILGPNRHIIGSGPKALNRASG